MKTFLFVCILTASFSRSICVFDDKTKKEMQNVEMCTRTFMKTGDIKLGVPSYEPLLLGNFSIDFETTGGSYNYVHGHLQFLDVVIEGIPDYDVEYIPRKAGVNSTIDFPILTAVGNYETRDVSFLGRPVEESGKFRASVSDVSIEIFLKKVGQNLTASTKLDVGKTEFEIDSNKRSDLGNQVSQSLSKSIEKLINDNNYLAGDILRKILKSQDFEDKSSFAKLTAFCSNQIYAHSTDVFKAIIGLIMY